MTNLMNGHQGLPAIPFYDCTLCVKIIRSVLECNPGSIFITCKHWLDTPRSRTAFPPALAAVEAKPLKHTLPVIAWVEVSTGSCCRDEEVTAHTGLFATSRVSATPVYRARDHLATRDSRRLRCRGIPIHSPLSLPWPGLDPSPSPGPVRLGPGHLFRYKKAPAGMLLLRNAIF